MNKKFVQRRYTTAPSVYGMAQSVEDMQDPLYRMGVAEIYERMRSRRKR